MKKVISVFTSALTKALKAAERIQCRVNNDTKSVYVCTSYLMVKLNRMEYDALVRPVTQRDPGNYALRNGEVDEREPLEMETIFSDAVKVAIHSMSAAPIVFDIPLAGRKKSAQLKGYYSQSGDFVAAFNVAYSSIVSGGLEFKGSKSVSPMVAFSGGEPVAMILPVRSDDKPNIVNAVRAWFGAGIGDMISREEHEETVSGLSAILEKTQANAEEYRNKWDDTACILNRAEREIEHLKSDIAAKNEEIASIKDELESNAVESTETETEPEEVQNTSAEPETATEAATAENDEIKKRMESGTHSIKFFYNGIKVNGGKLIKCSYSLDNCHDGKECVTIYSRSYRGDLPRDMFKVVNNSDSYNDYYEDDSAVVFPDHPLYRFVRYAAFKAETRGIDKLIEDKRIYVKLLLNRYNDPETKEYARPGKWAIKKAQDELSRLETLKADFDSMKDPGHPSAADVEAVHALNLAAETARLAEEKARELEEREKVLNERNDGRRYIETVSDEYPIVDGAPVVTIQWSEHPAFYSWEDGELKLSVAAAEIILKHYDQERAHRNQEEGRGGYDKTSFLINYTDASGEPSTYEGRYDLGDNDGGMIAHIRAFGKFLDEKGHFGNGNPTVEDKESAASISYLADLLEAHTAAGRIVSVSLAPWVDETIKAKKETIKQQVQDTIDTVEMLTDEQLTAAVLRSPKDKPDVARFFLQELAKRDEKKALSAFRAWRDGAGLEALDEI